ncbi:MAG TPA: type II toxin-antitoxin system VapC family toxin [Dongiaceae bacterium]|jgi:ribonuclease VapC|nr:type II toxin-antitoxin system VapC family toxin [Dongiaceae bacterium]
MVIDASAIVAIFFEETGFRRLLELIQDAPSRVVSAATLLEAGIVLDQSSAPSERDRLNDFLDGLQIRVAAFSEGQAQIAREAYRRYGKGLHPARLNFGDCMSYALAKSLDEPLLFKGTDFSLTDVKVAQ